MFDIGWSELLVIGVVAIVVVGPKDLPRLMRAFGNYTGKARRMAADFQRQFEEAVRDTEIDEFRKTMQDLRNEAVTPVNLDPPLMLPKEPASAQPAAATAPVPALPGPPPEPTPKVKAKPRAKRPAKSAKANPAEAKPRTPPETKPQTKSAKPRKPRERKS